MNAKDVAELGLCGIAADAANAVYKRDRRVCDYPITLDKLIAQMPAGASRARIDNRRS